MKPLPKESTWQRLQYSSRDANVDRDAGIIHGMVLAQQGPFKSKRGEFSKEGLQEIVKQINGMEKGLKSRFAHPTESDDGLGKFLGRFRDAKMSSAVNRDGKKVDAARASLHLDKSALEPSPNGGGTPLGVYVMNVLESDPDAISTSLVITPQQIFRLNKDGSAQTDEEGEELPPLWFPEKLHASDVVDEGDAVDSALSAESLAQALSVGLTDELRHLLRFDNVARLGAQLLDGMFKDADRDVIEARCQAWLQSYLEHRFPPVETPNLDKLAGRLAQMSLTVKKLTS